MFEIFWMPCVVWLSWKLISCMIYLIYHWGFQLAYRGTVIFCCLLKKEAYALCHLVSGYQHHLHCHIIFFSILTNSIINITLLFLFLRPLLWSFLLTVFLLPSPFIFSLFFSLCFSSCSFMFKPFPYLFCFVVDFFLAKNQLNLLSKQELFCFSISHFVLIFIMHTCLASSIEIWWALMACLRHLARFCDVWRPAWPSPSPPIPLSVPNSPVTIMTNGAAEESVAQAALRDLTERPKPSGPAPRSSTIIITGVKRVRHRNYHHHDDRGEKDKGLQLHTTRGC